MENTNILSLAEKLKVLGFTKSQGQNSPLLFVADLENKANILTPFQVLELLNAKSFKATAIYLRYFPDNRSPQTQVYIYDNTGRRLGKKYSEIHRELWSSCQIPTFIVIEDTSIKIFDCRKPVKVGPNGDIYSEAVAKVDLKRIEDYAKILEDYNAQKFSNGSFWESEEAKEHFTYKSTAYSSLINSLSSLRLEHSSSTKLTKSRFDYVIIITTLIKFLEENGVDENGNNLASDFFFEAVGKRELIDIIYDGKIVELLDALALKFNGGIFSLDEEDRRAIKASNLKKIGDFFGGVDKHQYLLWPQYSFKHIPVELISNIYEEFLPHNDKGAVYTPHYLVNFLLDECIPVPDRFTEIDLTKYKTIDVSCGSGIFLVNTFKRLVQLFKISEFKKSGVFPKLGIQNLQKILRENIFGIDINQNAVELSKFSLQLALCQMLSPKQIWTELRFQDLGRNNVIKKDFFDFISDNTNRGQFNFVIGNPPFNPPLDDNLKRIKNSKYYNNIINKYRFDVPEIGDCNLALLFLNLSPSLLSSSGLLCLIQPSIPLIHKSENNFFRSAFFSQYKVHQVIDFTCLRRVLFPTATVPVCAIFLSNAENEKHTSLTHCVVRRTNPSKERLYFEIDTYDLHQIAIESVNDSTIWKSNIFGGYRLNKLVKKLQVERTLIDFATELGVEISLYSAQKFKKLKGGSTCILVKKEITRGEFPRIVQYGNSETLMISGPKEGVNKLVGFLEKESKVLVSYIAGSSTRQGLDRPYNINKSDFETLPYFNSRVIGKFDRIVANDVAEYGVSAFSNGENSIVNKELQIYSGKVPIELKKYIEVYVTCLDSIYKTEGQRFYCKTIFCVGGNFLLEFKYSNSPTETIIEYDSSKISSLIEQKLTPSLLTRRTFTIFQGSSICIMKPKHLRYWQQSVALVDADNTMSEIVSLKLKEN